jgi:flagellar protein FlaG
MTTSIINKSDANPVAMPSEGLKKSSNSAQDLTAKTVTVLPSAKVLPVVTDDSLKASVNFINNFMGNIQRDLAFSIDAESNRTVITVLDSKSGNVIRQIPTEQVLDMVSRIRENTDAKGVLPQGLLFSDYI